MTEDLKAEDLKAVRTLFLDAGGVLVVPNWQRVSEALAAHGVAVSAQALAAADPHARYAIDIGMGGSASDQQRGWVYFNVVLEQAGIHPSAATDAALAELQAYHSTVNLWETIPDGVPEALARLRGLGLQLVVVSNANGLLRLLMDRVGLSPLFAVMLDSHVEGVEKPDRRLFDLALERSGASRESTLHAGDLYHVDVEGARAAGLRAVLVDPLDLYAGYDCERVHSLGELADRLGHSV
ncbi:MAG TPA: HAD family hydrolase [Vicinamibacterales bacterium]|nr:HAD family hydrolase [Vicinamibacterales bacterium]